jgi:uncharacterized MAPEG superfamily protein
MKFGRLYLAKAGLWEIATMTFELTMLTLSIILGFAQIALASHAASLQRGYRWTASARDEVLPPLAGIAGRLARAQGNFNETFPYFAAAVLIAHVVGIHDWRTHWGAALYFAARLAYVPLYGFGVPLVRSLVWNVAFIGIALVLWAAALP